MKQTVKNLQVSLKKLRGLLRHGLHRDPHAYIPSKGEQLVRYYGYSSNVSRSKRKKEKPVVGWGIGLALQHSQSDGRSCQQNLRIAGLSWGSR